MQTGDIGRIVVIAGKHVTTQRLLQFREMTARTKIRNMGAVEYPPHVSGHRLSGSGGGTMTITLTHSLNVPRQDMLLEELIRIHFDYVREVAWLTNKELEVLTRASRRDHNPNCRRNACLDLPKIVSQIIGRLIQLA